MIFDIDVLEEGSDVRDRLYAVKLLTDTNCILMKDKHDNIIKKILSPKVLFTQMGMIIVGEINEAPSGLMPKYEKTIWNVRLCTI